MCAHIPHKEEPAASSRLYIYATGEISGRKKFWNWDGWNYIPCCYCCRRCYWQCSVARVCLCRVDRGWVGGIPELRGGGCAWCGDVNLKFPDDDPIPLFFTPYWYMVCMYKNTSARTHTDTLIETLCLMELAWQWHADTPRKRRRERVGPRRGKKITTRGASDFCVHIYIFRST